jgi:hypothetical protein
VNAIYRIDQLPADVQAFIAANNLDRNHDGSIDANEARAITDAIAKSKSGDAKLIGQSLVSATAGGLSVPRSQDGAKFIADTIAKNKLEATIALTAEQLRSADVPERIKLIQSITNAAGHQQQHFFGHVATSSDPHIMDIINSTPDAAKPALIEALTDAKLTGTLVSKVTSSPSGEQLQTFLANYAWASGTPEEVARTISALSGLDVRTLGDQIKQASDKKSSEFGNAVAEALINQQTMRYVVPQVFGRAPQFSCTVRADIDRAASWRSSMEQRADNDGEVFGQFVRKLPPGSARTRVQAEFERNHDVDQEVRYSMSARECADKLDTEAREQEAIAKQAAIEAARQEELARVAAAQAEAERRAAPPVSQRPAQHTAPVRPSTAPAAAQEPAAPAAPPAPPKRLNLGAGVGRNAVPTTSPITSGPAAQSQAPATLNLGNAQAPASPAQAPRLQAPTPAATQAPLSLGNKPATPAAAPLNLGPAIKN